MKVSTGLSQSPPIDATALALAVGMPSRASVINCEPPYNETTILLVGLNMSDYHIK